MHVPKNPEEALAQAMAGFKTSGSEEEEEEHPKRVKRIPFDSF